MGNGEDMKEANMIEQIRERLSKITPYPWRVVDGKSFGVQSENKNIACCFRKENEIFIANAPTDIEYLLAEIDRITKDNRECYEEKSELRSANICLEEDIKQLKAENEALKKQVNDIVMDVTVKHILGLKARDKDNE